MKNKTGLATRFLKPEAIPRDCTFILQRWIKPLCGLALTMMILTYAPPPVQAAEFATIKASRAYMRAGPGQRYPIIWVYQRRGLPVQLLDSFGHWRKIRDPDGAEGWMHHILLKDRTTVMIRSNAPVAMRRQPDPDSQTIAALESGLVASLNTCRESACRIAAGGYRGWVSKKYLWGVAPSREFN